MKRLVLKRKKAAPPVDVAAIALRLAVMLQAGIAPQSAWRHLGDSEPAVAPIAKRIAKERDVVEVLTSSNREWRDLAAAWHVASTVGAPLGPSLRAIAGALGDAQAAADDAKVALTEPAASARLMLWLPVVGLLLGAVLGFDTFGVITTTIAGAVCVGLGLLLVLIARAWTKRLVAVATATGELPGLDAELIALALSGGVSVSGAREIVREVRPVVDDEQQQTESVLELSATAGVPAVELLRATGEYARSQAKLHARRKAAKLSTKLLLPLALCTLPAFLLLGVAPMLLSIIFSTALP